MSVTNLPNSIAEQSCHRFPRISRTGQISFQRVFIRVHLWPISYYVPTVAQSEPTRDPRLFIHNLVRRDPLAGLAEDVRKGLSAQPKRFLPKYFYDELGSQLFE